MEESIIFKGVDCKAERVNIYVKKGAYSHGNVKGWQLVNMDGEIMLSGHPGQPRNAYEYQKPVYSTKKELLDDVKYENEHWEAMSARRLK